MKFVIEIALPAQDASAPQVHRILTPQPNMKFDCAQPDGELYYRTKQSGGLTIQGDDFTWLKTQYDRFPCCVEVAVNVFTPSCDGETDELFWPGYFNLATVRWNFSECTAEVRDVLPRDGYDALFRIWEKPVNLLATSTENPLPYKSFVAIYPDKRTWSPNAKGQLVNLLPDGNAAGTGPSSQEHTYRQGIDLMTAINRVFDQIATGLPAQVLSPITSEFYELAVNPVTSRENLNKIIMAGSDAKRPASVTPAVTLTVTLKELLEGLRGLHNVYYLIDPETGKLRLEHRSWFAEQSYVQLGRVALNLDRYPDALAKANNESFDTEALYGIEELVIENNAGAEKKEFARGSVRYDDGCVVRDEKGAVRTNSISVSRFFTDLDAAYSNPDSVPDDAIFLAELMKPKAYGAPASSLPMLASAFEVVEYRDYTTVVGLGNNGYQAASMLFVDYHRHGRSFSSGLVNAVKQSDGSYAAGVRMAMLSTLPTRRQENIAIPVCCEDLPLRLNGYIKTNRFERAVLANAVLDPSTDILTLDVLADSRCQQLVIQPPDPGSDCAPKGTYISHRTEVAYCSDGVTVMATQDIYTYADGACGTIDEYGSTMGAGGC
ncbi:hypothetical protein GGR92_005221 [Spirosoma lacussanchae]|uniref:hypothetical protein n=1 Tax=Spirosoma lacussanchae TaxID=1884249 RepID=UPI001108417A|nr:hypothetical protein [Spirosoma lacussanchae]